MFFCLLYNSFSVSSQNQNGTTSTSCNNCKRKSLSKMSRGSCKLCRSSSLYNDKEQQQSTSKDTTANNVATKSKKGNWSLKLNCAKLKGSGSSGGSSTSSKTSTQPQVLQHNHQQNSSSSIHPNSGVKVRISFDF